MSCLNRYQRLACLTLASLCFSLATKPTLGALEVPVISQTTSVKPESSLPGPSKEKIAEQVSGQKVSNADIQDVLSDVDSRIPSEFAIPKELRANVNLWLKVYAQLTSQQVVIFDENHPEMIYDSLDFSELSRTARNRAAYEITMKLRIKKAVAGIRGALADLSKNAAPKNPNSMQKTILTNMKRMRHVHKFRDLIKTVRVQTGQRDFVVSGLAAAEVFFPHMDRIFKDLGVPPELTRLALVESSFNVRAISKVGAVGVWQFMKPSAKEYMTVDASAGLDERLSPLKSTVAAAKLLKRNHKALGSWMLAITSYNHGLRTFFANRQLIKTQAGRLQLFDPCSHVKRKLGFASRN